MLRPKPFLLLLTFCFVAVSGLEPARSQSSSAMTRARMQLVIDTALTNPAIQPAPARIATPLGLAPPGEDYPLRQARLSVQTGSARYVGVHPEVRSGAGGTDKMVWFHPATDGSIRFWVTDLRGRLLNAAVLREGTLTLLTVESAAAEFESEMLLWASDPAFR
ncbi:MAG: hypothetical protein AB7H66_17170 [Hyphomonadaceae bacterium]